MCAKIEELRLFSIENGRFQRNVRASICKKVDAKRERISSLSVDRARSDVISLTIKNNNLTVKDN